MRKVLFIFGLVLLPVSAMAHDAPAGWAYDGACCSGIDCQPAKISQVEQTPKGYLVHKTDDVNETLVPYSDTRIHWSHDKNYHVCSYILSSKNLICLYVPQGDS